jgi:hypothetical protein
MVTCLNIHTFNLRNVLPYGQDTAVGLVKWFFNGRELGYEVQNIQQEYRFPLENGSDDVLFTVQWSFLGQGHYGGNPERFLSLIFL